MERTFYASKDDISNIQAGEIVCVGFLTKSNLLDKWTDATIDFTVSHDVDTTGLPFVFEASLVSCGKTIINGPSVYVVCMHYFSKIKKHRGVVLFGAMCAVGLTDKFTPEQVISFARENKKSARSSIAWMERICL